ncbi:MAG: hypothetical protein ACR2RF_20695 [Geminicoccaceae bacterium]
MLQPKTRKVKNLNTIEFIGGTGATQDLKQAQFFGRLQMISWQDKAFPYAVVGFADFETLGTVATWLESNYGEDA